MTIDEIKKIAIPACKEYDVKRLDIFGSHARREKSESSDIDFIVEFNEPAYKPSKRYFDLLHYFEDTFKSAIDLVTLGGVKNPYFRDRVIRERINIYGA